MQPPCDAQRLSRALPQIFEARKCLQGRADRELPRPLIERRLGAHRTAQRGRVRARRVRGESCRRRRPAPPPAAPPGARFPPPAREGARRGLHEPGHYGLEEFLRTRSRLVRGAAAWIHLGANFGAAVGGDPLLQASAPGLQERAVEALQRAGAAPPRRRPAGEPPAGEARRVHAGGGTYLSIVGANRLFHHPRDRSTSTGSPATPAPSPTWGCNWRTAEGNRPARALPARRGYPRRVPAATRRGTPVRGRRNRPRRFGTRPRLRGCTSDL